MHFEIQTNESKKFSWSDKNQEEMIFDCLMFATPTAFVSYVFLNTYQQVGGGIFIMFLATASLSAFLFWHFSSHRQFVIEAEKLFVTRFVVFVLPVNNKQYLKTDVKDAEIVEGRGFLTGSCFALVFRMKDGSSLTARTSSNRSELYGITARL